MNLFPTLTKLSKEEITKRYERVVNNISFDKQYHFELILNSNMKVNFKLTAEANLSEEYILLNVFESDATVRSRVAVEVYKCPKEVNPSDYQRMLIVSNEEAIINYREIPMESGLRGDYLTQKKINNKDYTIRASSLKNGELIFVVKCSVETKFYNEAIAEDFVIAVNSFKLIDTVIKNYSEKLKIYSAHLPVPINFSLPVSYVLENDKSQTPDTTFFSFTCQNERKAGVNLIFYSTVKVEENILQKYFEQLDQNGIQVNTADVKTSVSSDNKVITYSANAIQNKILLSISAFYFKGGITNVFCASISPSFENDMQASALSRRGIDVIRQTLQVGEKKWTFTNS